MVRPSRRRASFIENLRRNALLQGNNCQIQPTIRRIGGHERPELDFPFYESTKGLRDEEIEKLLTLKSCVNSFTVGMETIEVVPENSAPSVKIAGKREVGPSTCDAVITEGSTNNEDEAMACVNEVAISKKPKSVFVSEHSGLPVTMTGKRQAGLSNTRNEVVISLGSTNTEDEAMAWDNEVKISEKYLDLVRDSDSSGPDDSEKDSVYEPSDTPNESSFSSENKDDNLEDDLLMPVSPSVQSDKSGSLAWSIDLEERDPSFSENDVNAACSPGPVHPDDHEIPAQQSDVYPVNGKSTKRIRAKEYCFYCEEHVLQFSRHIERNHINEMDVQQLLAYKKNSKERKRLLAVLRNKGNYFHSRSTNSIKLVRKPILNRDTSQPLPCKYCLGFFARKHLWRHLKRCPKNGNHKEKLINCQNLAQNMLLKQIKGNDFLKNIVFPHMRADDITLTVKKDPLICAYASRFAKTHQEKHHINIISRKMRELGKLLIEIRKGEPTVKTLLDALKPQHFDLLVEAAKRASKYDEKTNKYGSPTYAMNISTSLKECCEISCNFLYRNASFPDKESYERAEFDFKRLITMISSDWKYEVSHQAANDLQKTTMNRITIVPIASDLKKFKKYLQDLADDSFATLQVDENDESAYRTLIESVYCKVMLLCRKRCGELARLTVELYEKSGERQSYEEFADAIQPSEMLLVRKFKRVVIQGKRKATPVIFSDDVQQQIDFLLKLRPNFTNESNPYLFAKGQTENPISGYQVITRHAAKAGLKNPGAITTRSLRKHLATVCQVLSMSDQDVEQLASFMGHTGNIHRNEYRLPDDVFQTAKVSKLLLMMESGQAAQFKGKTLDEINLDMEEDLTETQHNSDHEDEEGLDGLEGGLHKVVENTKATNSSVPAPARKNKRVLEKWTESQKRIVVSYFAEHIKGKRPPKRGECEVLINQNLQEFKNKSWEKIKVYVQNVYSNKIKMKKLIHE